MDTTDGCTQKLWITLWETAQSTPQTRTNTGLLHFAQKKGSYLSLPFLYSKAIILTPHPYHTGGALAGF